MLVLQARRALETVAESQRQSERGVHGLDFVCAGSHQLHPFKVPAAGRLALMARSDAAAESPAAEAPRSMVGSTGEEAPAAQAGYLQHVGDPKREHATTLRFATSHILHVSWVKLAISAVASCSARGFSLCQRQTAAPS